MNQTILKLFPSILIIIITLLFFNYCYSKEQQINHSFINNDSDIIDVTFYDLALDIDIKTKQIDAEAICHFTVLSPQDTFYLDLHQQLKVSSVTDGFQRLNFFQKNNKLGFSFRKQPNLNESKKVKITYSGTPAKLTGVGVEKGVIFGSNKRKEPVIATL